MKRSLVVAALLLPSAAHAQVIAEQAPPTFPDPKRFARGFYAQGELGALVYVGHAGRYAGPGPSFSLRLGYDLLRWLSIQAHVLGSSGRVTVPGPTDGQAYQTFLYGGEAHAQLQLRRVGLYVEAGAVAAHIPSNVLDDAAVTGGRKISLAVVAGGGIDFHTLNRHFSIGLGADYLWLASFGKSSAVAAQAFLKYTR